MRRISSDGVFSAFACGILAGAVIALYVYRTRTDHGIGHLENALTYADTVVIVLASVTVVITCAALVIGILGVFGYQRLKQDAAQESISLALERVEKEMSDGGVLRQILVERSDEFLATYNRGRTQDEEWGKENTEYGE